MLVRFLPQNRKCVALAARCLVAALSFWTCFSGVACGQGAAADRQQSVTFVQFTDAHIFDDGWNESVSGAMRMAADDRDALTWAINETNHLISQGQRIDFAVFTGDLGLQNVETPPSCSAQPVRFEPGQTPIRFDSALREMSDELARLSVKSVYFLPGNNDVIDEQITDLPRYTCFISELQKRMASSSSGTNVAMLELRSTFLLNGVNFTGLDTSTFKKAKNYQSICTSAPIAMGKKSSAPTPQSCPQTQLTYLRKLVSPSAKSPLIIFTHVPDVNDPFRKTPTWQDFAPALRKDWDDEACRANVIGIFAGHLHDSDRRYYGGPTGARLLATTACVAAKTWIAPPLAIKNQIGKSPRARGFLVATVSPTREIHADVHWFEPGNGSSRECPSEDPEGRRRNWVEIVLLLVVVLAVVGLTLWSTLRKGESKMRNQDAVAMTAVFFFLVLCFAVLWFVRVRLGITESAIQIAVLVLIVLVYGVVSGRLTEFSGPGGWGAKFHEVASSKIDADKLDLTDTEMQNIPKMGLQEVERKIQSIAPGKPIVLSLTLGRGYYDIAALRDSVKALARFPSFRFILFLTQEGSLVSYIPCQTLLGLLAPPIPGTPVPAGAAGVPGLDLVNAVNVGNGSLVSNYIGMIQKTVSDRASNWEALEAMESIGLDAIVVVDADRKPKGVAERGRITSRMLAALAKG